MSSWAQLILIGLCYALVLCHSFKGCALPPSLLFHSLFLSPIWAHNVASTIFWRDNQKIAGLGKEILYNIQPLNPTQHWSRWRTWGCQNASPGVPGGQPALTCLRILSSKGCHASTCSGIHQSQGSQEVVMPRPAQGPYSQEAVMPRPAWGFNL